MAYTTEAGGLLITCGYTRYVNVWSPDASLSKAYIGRLEGHQGIIVVCKMFSKSTSAASIDDRLTIKLWDVK